MTAFNPAVAAIAAITLALSPISLAKVTPQWGDPLCRAFPALPWCPR